MADSMTAPITHCPWCSAVLADPGAEKCVTCGAMLVAAPDTPGEIKGVTTLDTEAILRARSEVSRPRGGRLVRFITGEAPVDTSADVTPGSVAPPDSVVRREMLRLQLEAEAADLQAEALALKADELARRGIHLDELGGPAVPAAEATPEPPPPDALPAPDDASPAPDATPPAGEWPAELVPGEDEAPPAQG